MSTHRKPLPYPRWLTPVLAGWGALAAVTIANATAVPVHVEAVVAYWGLLALAHGLAHRGWRVAGPLATAAGLALALALGAAVLGVWPEGLQTRYQGPAGSVAVQVIWASALTVATLNLAWALVLHRWTQHALAGSASPGRGRPGRG